jgi:hypothetical protein
MLFLSIIAVFLCFIIPLMVVAWLFDKYKSDICPEIYMWGTFMLEFVFFLQILRWMGDI